MKQIIFLILYLCVQTALLQEPPYQNPSFLEIKSDKANLQVQDYEYLTGQFIKQDLNKTNSLNQIDQKQPFIVSQQGEQNKDTNVQIDLSINQTQNSREILQNLTISNVTIEKNVSTQINQTDIKTDRNVQMIQNNDSNIIRQENYTNKEAQQELINDSVKNRFRDVHSFLNDLLYTSLDQVPIDQMVKRQIEDLIILPRKVDLESGIAFKYNRVLFYGYSNELMEETAKAMALENKWLFNQVDSSEILVNFMKGDQFYQESQNFRQLFKNAEDESINERTPYVLLIKNVEALLTNTGHEGAYLIDQIRQWFYGELDKYVSLQTPLELKRYPRFQPDIIVVFTTSHPYMMNDGLLQQLCHKAIFFDFPNLKSIKILLAKELQALDNQFQMKQNGQQYSEYELLGLVI